MKFRTKYMLRNKTLGLLFSLCGMTSLTIAYGIIKWQKVKYYGDWMFQGISLQNHESWNWLFNNYFKIGGISILWCLFFAIIIDMILKRLVVNNLNRPTSYLKHRPKPRL